jgi:hypothetical protein
MTPVGEKRRGAATTMVVVVPAGSAVGTIVTDVGTNHIQAFVAGNTFDVRMDDTADASAATLSISATLAVAA